MELIRISGLRVAFSTCSEEIRAVDSVDLDIRSGDSLSLIGESGCGKTVMGMAIMGLLPKNAMISGSIRYGDQEILSASDRTMQQIRGKEIAMISQNSANSLNPVMTIGDQIEEPLLIHHLLPSTEARSEAIRLLSALGFDEPETAAGRYPHEFSGGMRERILIALALICNPRLIIADEPTAGLDAQVKSQILRLIKKQIASNRTLFLITHDMGTASSLSTRMAVMYAGELVEAGPTKEVLAMPRHPYTQGLLASLPSAGLHPIPGMSPAPAHLPKGCRFCARCPSATDRCSTQHPPLEETRDTRQVRCFLYD
ncbi:ABC transporter ATP-binding protein [Methanoregula sp.]|uniref:ABC transporter ATP-binding protein n=1 Tax=Methanoregula sp. TaxID=2052170 RepID=UPI003BAF40DE